MPTRTAPPRPSQAMDSSADRIQPALRAWIHGLTAGSPHVVGTLELTPLVGAASAGGAPALLRDAMQSGQLEIIEEGPGNVNAVMAYNRGESAVLILEGESIVGAKQNRVVTLDVLIAAGATVMVPVGCVERGRWAPHFSKFDSSDAIVEPSIRARTVAEMSARGGLDQSRLWAQVSAKLAAARVSSSTGAYHEFVAAKGAEAEAALRAVPAAPGQVGVLVLMDGSLAGFDVVGHAAHWSALSARLLRSYVLEALYKPAGPHFVAPAGDDSTPPLLAKDWLHEISQASVRTRPAAGLGVQVALAGDGFAGGGLWHETLPAHLSAFAVAHRKSPARAPRWEPVCI